MMLIRIDSVVSLLVLFAFERGQFYHTSQVRHLSTTPNPTHLSGSLALGLSSARRSGATRARSVTPSSTGKSTCVRIRVCVWWV